MKELILSLMLWISNATGYPVPEPPGLLFLSTSGIKAYAYGCDDIPIPKGNEDICNSREFWDLDESSSSPMALYNHRTKQIILNEDLDIDTIRDQSVVMHELVHHLQNMGGKEFEKECKGDLEKEAYLLQDKWLKETYDVDVWSTIGINELYFIILTNCSDRMTGDPLGLPGGSSGNHGTPGLEH